MQNVQLTYNGNNPATINYSGGCGTPPQPTAAMPHKLETQLRTL
ncbi:MAG: hypothetical protein U0Q21_02340 [Dermatophilaceae bacterium]